VEEHFYILWPAFVRRLTSLSLALVSATIVILTPALRALAFATGHGGLEWYTWFVADGLAAGSLLAITLRTQISRKQVWILCTSLIVFSLTLGVAGEPFGIDTRTRLPGAALQYSVITMMGAGILLLFLLIGTGPARRWVNLPWLRFLGYLSYGLYLDHLLAFRLYDRFGQRLLPELMPAAGDFKLIALRFALAGGAALAVAYLSRKYIEERFLRLKDDRMPQPSTNVEDRATLPDQPAKAQPA
jgi:peptidoglycan/LPS O-acetylase OafA/YrhL